MVVIAVLIFAVFVFAVSHIVAVPICPMTVAVSIAIAGYLPVAVYAVVAIMVIPYNSRVAAEAVIIAIAEAGILAQTCIIHTPPLQIFPLALTAQPVVFDIVVASLRQPLAVSVVVIGAPVIAASSVIRT
jgi:hypothetical protein